MHCVGLPLPTHSILTHKILRSNNFDPRNQTHIGKCSCSTQFQSNKMPVKTIDANTSNFNQILQQFEADHSGTLKFLLFLADKDAVTNRSWCPDCVVAEPVIYEKLEASDSEVAVLRTCVGDRPTWRNPNNPMRIDPRFKLKGVPTLIRWEDGKIVGRLEDYEAHVGNKIDALLASK